MTKQDEIRACLREGPTTSSEIAATTGLTIRNASARLHWLELAGEVRRIGKVGPGHIPQRQAVLYEAARMKRAMKEARERV